MTDLVPGALALSIWRRPFVPWMIRGIGDRGDTVRGADMKVLLTFYGAEKVGLDSSPEEIARTFTTWGEFDEAAGRPAC